MRCRISDCRYTMFVRRHREVVCVVRCCCREKTKSWKLRFWDHHCYLNSSTSAFGTTLTTHNLMYPHRSPHTCRPNCRAIRQVKEARRLLQAPTLSLHDIRPILGETWSPKLKLVCRREATRRDETFPLASHRSCVLATALAAIRQAGCKIQKLL